MKKIVIREDFNHPFVNTVAEWIRTMKELDEQRVFEYKYEAGEITYQEMLAEWERIDKEYRKKYEEIERKTRIIKERYYAYEIDYYEALKELNKAEEEFKRSQEAKEKKE